MDKLIDVKHLKKYFYSGGTFLQSKRKEIKAVEDVSFSILRGETFGLVGESGCGKSTLGRTIAGLYTATDGQVLYDNVDITRLSKTARKPYNKKMQFVFQDPFSALNPYFTVQDILLEPMDIHLKIPKSEMLQKAETLLLKVGLSARDLEKYPHEFSGGQRQRIGIARALAVDPDFVLCDEPISALDVSIQAQVVNMLMDLQDELGLTYLFVAHDLSMVKHISNRIAVMYLGKIVEIAESNELYKNPQHPYSQALLSAIPVPDPKLARNSVENKLIGEVPSPINAPSGCGFRTRCPHCFHKCDKAAPELKEIAAGHYTACYLYE